MNTAVVAEQAAPERRVSCTDQTTGSSSAYRLASSKNKIATDPSSFKGYKRGHGHCRMADGIKYMVGQESNYHSALGKMQIYKKGLSGCFCSSIKGRKTHSIE